MKLKEILSGVCLLAGLLSACSTEEIISKEGEGKDTSFSLVLSTGDPVTKAVAPNYTYATADELVIGECVVAVFKVETNGSVGEMVGTPISFTSLTPTTTIGGKQGYSLTGITGKTGSARILVIANSPYAKYETLTTWDGFMAATEVTNESFEASKLVKVGYLDVTLASAETKPSYSVELAQLTARIDLKIVPSSDDYSFGLTNVKVENINTASDVLLVDRKNSQSQCTPTTDFKVFNEAGDGLTFYTYENVSETFVKVTFTGEVADHTTNVTETKNYSLVLNKDQAIEGLEHGTLYRVTGTYDVKTRQMTFDWSILPWSTTLREVYVDIIESAYLVVRDLEMTMPNMTTLSTTFESSSPVTISNVKISNGATYSNKKCTVTPAPGNSGSITINSELPTNFVPKEISFTVTNEEGLKQEVVVHQYPPLYITSHTTGVTWKDNQGQETKDMFIFKSLVADYSDMPEPDDQNNSNEKNDERWAKRGDYVTLIRNSAVLGYPKTITKTETKFNSTGYASEIYYDSKIVIETVDSPENEMLISPNFMLASQAGMNSPSDDYTDKQQFCRRYREYEINNGPVYDTGSWRMPTKAELYLIDILQNVKRCDVKKILEGGAYWAANKNILVMLDPRTGTTTTSAAVRCVRDIKE